MSTFTDQKMGVADMLDYLMKTRDFLRTESGEEVMQIFPSDYHKTKMPYEDLLSILHWMEDEEWIKIIFEFDDIDDYAAEKSLNDGHEVSIFKLAITSYGKNAIERILFNQEVKTKGARFEEGSGRLSIEGRFVHTFRASNSTYKIFKRMWDRASFNNRSSEKGIKLSLGQLSDELDLKVKILETKIKEINHTLAKKRIPLRISRNANMIFLEELDRKK